MTLLFLNIGTPEIIIILMALFVGFLLPLFALIDILRSDFRDSTTKLIWVLVILLIPLIGWVLYYLIGKNQKIISSK